METHCAPKQTEFSDVTNVIQSLYSPLVLQDKVALVTGASRGIGRAIAVALGAMGARVIVNYAGRVEDAQCTVGEIIKHGGLASCVQFDVSHFTLVQETVKNLEKEFGFISILVNNAGVSRDNLLVKFKEEEWDETLSTNLKGAFNCSRAVSMGMMRKHTGKIINISSVVGLTGNPGQSAYCASKAGLIGLTRSMAQELASRNIQINAIAPGYIATEMTSALSAETIKKIEEKIPAKKIGLPLDVAKAVGFLASAASDYVTGQVFAVDGGMTMY